jgi:DHA2 family multidrug resistance protein
MGGICDGVMGVFAVLLAHRRTDGRKYDPRKIIFAGIMGLAGLAAWRTSFNSDVTFWQAAMPTLLTGPFMVMFFIPTIGLAMASVDPGEEANAAGVQLHAHRGGGLCHLAGPDLGE